MATRLHLPFAVLNDAALALTDPLCRPTFEVDGMRLLERLTFIIRGTIIEAVFHPIRHPEENVIDVIDEFGAYPI